MVPPTRSCLPHTLQEAALPALWPRKTSSRTFYPPCRWGCHCSLNYGHGLFLQGSRVCVLSRGRSVSSGAPGSVCVFGCLQRPPATPWGPAHTWLDAKNERVAVSSRAGCGSRPPGPGSEVQFLQLSLLSLSSGLPSVSGDERASHVALVCQGSPEHVPRLRAQTQGLTSHGSGGLAIRMWTWLVSPVSSLLVDGGFSPGTSVS